MESRDSRQFLTVPSRTTRVGMLVQGSLRGRSIDSSPDELFFSTAAIDDTWDGGRFGFLRNSGVDDTVTQEFDNLVIQVDAGGARRTRCSRPRRSEERRGGK